MPLLEVEIVLGAGEEVQAGLAAASVEATAKVLNAPEGSTWVRLREISAEHYAENGGPVEVRPVFVRVLKARLPAEDELEREAAGLAMAIARVCNRPPENVHIIFEPPAAGRIALGGKLLRGTP